MKYPAILTPDDNGGFTVSFRDIPEANTAGENEADALDMAQDALATAMDFYFEDRRPVPAPSKARNGERLVALPPSVSAKVLLLNLMIERQVRPADLARSMSIKPQEVTRILDLGHATKIDTLAAAFKALGKELTLDVA